MLIFCDLRGFGCLTAMPLRSVSRSWHFFCRRWGADRISLRVALAGLWPDQQRVGDLGQVGYLLYETRVRQR
jgi:hypothetical protein